MLNKLRNATLTEADLQRGIRVQLDPREEELIKNNNRFSKENYSLRKNYSIESAMLEKRLILDNS